MKEQDCEYCKYCKTVNMVAEAIKMAGLFKERRLLRELYSGECTKMVVAIEKLQRTVGGNVN